MPSARILPFLVSIARALQTVGPADWLWRLPSISLAASVACLIGPALLTYNSKCDRIARLPNGYATPAAARLLAGRLRRHLSPFPWLWLRREIDDRRAPPGRTILGSEERVDQDIKSLSRSFAQFIVPTEQAIGFLQMAAYGRKGRGHRHLSMSPPMCDGFAPATVSIGKTGKPAF